jgi:hypothetical protein
MVAVARCKPSPTPHGPKPRGPSLSLRPPGSWLPYTAPFATQLLHWSGLASSVRYAPFIGAGGSDRLVTEVGTQAQHSPLLFTY